jgi:hypothetical protein
MLREPRVSEISGGLLTATGEDCVAFLSWEKIEDIDAVCSEAISVRRQHDFEKKCSFKEALMDERNFAKWH